MPTGIALGSNTGDRLRNLLRARDALAALYGKVLCSRVYETEPVGCEPDAPAFLNAVVEIGYDGSPARLLRELQAIETEMGRPSRHPRNAPRPIDLDILFMDDRMVSEAGVEIPHPRLHLRRFVLAPLCDIRPGLILPGQSRTVAGLLAQLPPEPHVTLFAETL